MISYKNFSEALSPKDVQTLSFVTKRQFKIVSKLSQIKNEPKEKFERSITVLERATSRTRSRGIKAISALTSPPNVEMETIGLLSTEVGSRNQKLHKIEYGSLE